MKIALVSMSQTWDDEGANKETARFYTTQAALNGASMVVFPEMTLTSYIINANLAQEWEGSDSVAFFSSLAKEHGVSIVFGLPAKQNGKVYNLAVAVDADGSVTAKYAKIHPFSYSNEQHVYTAGDELAFFSHENITFGLTICYDLRFAPLYAAMSRSCDAFLVIASWPKSRVGHWRTLLDARAIENQCYCVGVNRTGVDANGLEYEKSSMVAGFDGSEQQKLVCVGDMDIYELDMAQQQKYRESFPVLQDRRDELYIKFLRDNG